MKNVILTSLSLIAFLFISFPIQAQWNWLSSGYAMNQNTSGSNYALAIDPSGCTYTTGFFIGAGTSYGITFEKFAPDGKKLLSKLVKPTVDKPTGYDIGVSAANNIVAIGGTTNGTAFSGTPYLGFFRADNGNNAVFPKIPFTGNGVIFNLEIRGNYVWVIGNFQGVLGLQTGAGNTINAGNSNLLGNIFIAKYNMVTGALAKYMYLQGSTVMAQDIKIDNNENIFFTSVISSAVTFRNQNNTVFYTYNLNSAGQSEVLAAKIDATMSSCLWAKPLVNYSNNNLPFGFHEHPIAFDLGAGAIITGGDFGNSTTSYLQKRSASNGNLLNQITVNNKKIQDIAIAPCSQNVYVTGGNGLFLDRYHLSNLSFLSGQQSSTWSLGYALVLDGAEKPVVTGFYNGSVFSINNTVINSTSSRGNITGLFNPPSACCANRGILLDGVDDYLAYSGYTPTFGNIDFTFEAWVYSFATESNCTTNFRRLFSIGKSTGPSIEIGDCAGKLSIHYKTTSTATYTINNTGVTVRSGWHHVAVSRNSATNQLCVYVDGMQYGTYTVPTIILPSDAIINIGRTLNATTNGAENWFGMIDEVRLWNVVRTPTQISSKSLCYLKGNEAGLLVYYPFEQGMPAGINSGANIAWNYSAYQNTAILMNFALTGNTSNWICASSSGLNISGTCTPFAPGDDVDNRSESLDDQATNDVLGNKVSLFPNPNSGEFMIRLAKKSDNDLSIRVTSITGQLLLEQIVPGTETQHGIKAAELPAGLYILQVVEENKVLATTKFVKQ